MRGLQRQRQRATYFFFRYDLKAFVRDTKNEEKEKAEEEVEEDKEEDKEEDG